MIFLCLEPFEKQTKLRAPIKLLSVKQIKLLSIRRAFEVVEKCAIMIQKLLRLTRS